MEVSAFGLSESRGIESRQSWKMGEEELKSKLQGNAPLSKDTRKSRAVFYLGLHTHVVIRKLSQTWAAAELCGLL